MTTTVRNSLIALICIGLIIFGLSWFTKPAHAPAEVSTSVVTSTPDVSPATATVLIKLPQQTITSTVPLTAPLSVADALQQVAQAKNLPIESKDYGPSMGLLIESINGIHNDTKANTYWYFTVNGQLSPTGASTTMIESGDSIAWQYGVVPTP